MQLSISILPFFILIYKIASIIGNFTNIIGTIHICLIFNKMLKLDLYQLLILEVQLCNSKSMKEDIL